MTGRAIIHVDMDAFYAAVEVLDHPQWKGLPLVVAGLGKRGVVSTCSYEARKFGVRSAMATSEARRRCPDAVYVEPRMARYVEVSATVFAVFNEVTPQIEGLSLDEAFLDVGASLTLFGDIESIGRRIKTEIKRRTRLNASVGMAHNKLLAKFASELSKPDGFLHLRREDVRRTLDPLGVGRMWTVGKVAEGKLLTAGIRTIGDLRCADPARLTRVLGRQSAELQRLAAGEDERAVVANREEKSISAENTFGDDLTELADARSWLMRLCERAAERVRRQSLQARTVTVKLRAPPFETSTRQVTLSVATAATSEIYHCALVLLDRWWKEQRVPRLRLLGVSLSGFHAKESEPEVALAQADLFGGVSASESGLVDAHAVAQAEDQLADRINAKFGKGALHRARALPKADG